MPWWLWLIVAILGFIAYLVWAVVRFRRMIQREFVAYLKEHRSDYEVVREHRGALEVKLPDGRAGLVVLGHLIAMMVTLRPRNTQDRTRVYEHFLKSIEDQREGGNVAADEDESADDLDSSDLLPRLVTRDFFSQAPETAGVVNIPLGETGLFVVFVVDGEESVMYLDQEHVDALELSIAQIMEVAVENLRDRFDIDDDYDRARQDGTIVAIEADDTYDAARILLLPDLLEDDEALVAAVPDRDCLVFAKWPADGNLSLFSDMLKFEGDKPLLPRLLKVTSEGIQLA